MSDDGRFGLTLILMIGSVFSPFYRKAIAEGRGDPARHAAVNLALYNLSRPGGSWLGPALGRRSGDLWALRVSNADQCGSCQKWVLAWVMVWVREVGGVTV